MKVEKPQKEHYIAAERHVSDFSPHHADSDSSFKLPASPEYWTDAGCCVFFIFPFFLIYFLKIKFKPKTSRDHFFYVR